MKHPADGTSGSSFFINCGFVAGGLELVGVAQQTKMRKALRQDDQNKTKSRLHTYIHTYYIHKCIVAVHETKANKIKQTLKRRAHAREPHLVAAKVVYNGVLCKKKNKNQVKHVRG